MTATSGERRRGDKSTRAHEQGKESNRGGQQGSWGPGDGFRERQCQGMRGETGPRAGPAAHAAQEQTPTTRHSCLPALGLAARRGRANALPCLPLPCLLGCTTHTHHHGATPNPSPSLPRRAFPAAAMKPSSYEA